MRTSTHVTQNSEIFGRGVEFPDHYSIKVRGSHIFSRRGRRRSRDYSPEEFNILKTIWEALESGRRRKYIGAIRKTPAIVFLTIV
jgi:hypothetical protein